MKIIGHVLLYHYKCSMEHPKRYFRYFINFILSIVLTKMLVLALRIVIIDFNDFAIRSVRFDASDMSNTLQLTVETRYICPFNLQLRNVCVNIMKNGNHLATFEKSKMFFKKNREFGLDCTIDITSVNGHNILSAIYEKCVDVSVNAHVFVRIFHFNIYIPLRLERTLNLVDNQHAKINGSFMYDFYISSETQAVLTVSSDDQIFPEYLSDVKFPEINLNTKIFGVNCILGVSAFRVVNGRLQNSTTIAFTFLKDYNINYVVACTYEFLIGLKQLEHEYKPFIIRNVINKDRICGILRDFLTELDVPVRSLLSHQTKKQIMWPEFSTRIVQAEKGFEIYFGTRGEAEKNEVYKFLYMIGKSNIFPFNIKLYSNKKPVDGSDNTSANSNQTRNSDFCTNDTKRHLFCEIGIECSISENDKKAPKNAIVHAVKKKSGKGASKALFKVSIDIKSWKDVIELFTTNDTFKLVMKPYAFKKQRIVCFYSKDKGIFFRCDRFSKRKNDFSFLASMVQPLVLKHRIKCDNDENIV